MYVLNEFLTTVCSCTPKYFFKTLIEVCTSHLYASFDTFLHPNWSIIRDTVTLWSIFENQQIACDDSLATLCGILLLFYFMIYSEYSIKCIGVVLWKQYLCLLVAYGVNDHLATAQKLTLILISFIFQRGRSRPHNVVNDKTLLYLMIPWRVKYQYIPFLWIFCKQYIHFFIGKLFWVGKQHEIKNFFTSLRCKKFSTFIKSS